MEMLNVVVAEDHEFFRNGLISALKEIDFVKIVDGVNNGKDLVDIVKKNKVDIVFTDIKMPVMDGFEATEIIKKANPEVKIIVLSLYDEEIYFKKMIELGVNGYILKNTSKTDLTRALLLIKDGKQYFAEEFLPFLTRQLVSNNQINEHDHLTDRELEVVQLVSMGLTNSEIAEKLFISKKTVINHRTNIMSKTGTNNSASLISYAYKHNLIS